MRRFFIIGIFAALLIALPLIIYILTTQKTTTKSGAAPATILKFDIPTDPAVVGTPITIPLTIDPSGAGTTPNTISFVKLAITYDGTKLQPASTYFAIGSQYSSKYTVLEGPTNSCVTPGSSGTPTATNNCTITATISTGADPGNAISSSTTDFAELTFNPIQTGTTKLIFDPSSQALSIASADNPADNVLVLSNLQPGSLVINAATITITPTNPPTAIPTTSGGGGSSGVSGGGSTSPISCSSLNANPTASNSAPLTVLLTAIGGSTAGTITKVSFNFGDGSVQDITTGGGIGTNNVSLQQSHIYQNTGTFTATAVLTDSQGNTTTPSSCSQTITIGTATPTQTPTVAPTTAPTIPPTGPGNVILGVGAVGLVITVVGLLFAVGI